MSELRAAISWLVDRPWFRRLVMRTPPGRAVVRRFVAGESLREAMVVARELQEVGIASMFDLLGEHVTTESGARALAAEHQDAVAEVREHAELDGAISVKLTQLGLDLSEDLCRENLERILEAAAGRTLVMIDMEHHEYVEPTIRLYREFHGRFERFGVCLQAYLHRTAEDVFTLPEGAIVRLVKGAYLEPHDLAFSRRRDVDRRFSLLFATLLGRGHTVHVATHDPRLIEGARLAVERREISWERVEFQMLYGIRRDLQNRLAREGYPVRVYVPYGTEWYPYLSRRLAERPANMWFFLHNLVRSGR